MQQISGERLQDHWSSGYPSFNPCTVFLTLSPLILSFSVHFMHQALRSNQPARNPREGVLQYIFFRKKRKKTAQVTGARIIMFQGFRGTHTNLPKTLKMTMQAPVAQVSSYV